jgi:tetratricopeptide (TPR) repeat protein
MRVRTPLSRAAATAALAFALLLPAGGGEARAGDDRRPVPGADRPLGVPAGGLDRVRLSDGRVISCRAEERRGAKEVLLHFPTFTATVPRERVLEVRRFADYDPEPRTDEERAQAAKGFVRFGGRWVPKEAAEKSVRDEEAAAKRFRDEDEFHAKWENRWKVETDHFLVEANLRRDAVDHYAALLESFYDFFTKAFQIRLTARERKQKLPVFLFRRRDEFRQFHDRDTGGKSENLLGYFVPAIGQERLVFYDLPGSREETVDVMFHEGTHFILHLAEPKVLVSRWIHEGCAEYFGASGFDGKRFTPGLVQDGRLLHFQDMIARGKVLPMEVLLRAGNPYSEAEGPVEFEGEHYAQAWTLVHYLMEGRKGRYRQGFISFLQKHLDRKGKLTALAGSEQKFMDYDESRAQLLRCLGIKDFDGLLKEVEEYALALPLRSARAYVERGLERYFDRRDPEGARADFDTAIEKGRDDPALLAMAASNFQLVPERSSESVALFRRSLELDPLDAGVRHRLARLLPPAEALAELEIAIQVDPDHGPSLGDFAWATYLTGVRDRTRAADDEVEAVRRAIAIARRAVAIDPSAEAHHALACLCLTVGEFEAARDAAKVAVEFDAESAYHQWTLAESYALLGQADEFARVLRRIELLLRREARRGEGGEGGEGGTATGLDPAAALEAVNEEMAGLVRRIAERCLAWEKRSEASAALDAWYERRLPKSADDWTFFSEVVRGAGNAKRARKIAEDGLKAFPDSAPLKEALRAAAGGEGEDAPPAPGESPK